MKSVENNVFENGTIDGYMVAAKDNETFFRNSLKLIKEKILSKHEIQISCLLFFYTKIAEKLLNK